MTPNDVAEELLGCSPCSDYWARRSFAVLRHLTTEDRTTLDAWAFSHFAQGVHMRHVEGLSLFVCKRCGCTPETPCDNRDELLEPDLCSTCVHKGIRYAVLYSIATPVHLGGDDNRGNSWRRSS